MEMEFFPLIEQTKDMLISNARFAKDMSNFFHNNFGENMDALSSDIRKQCLENFEKVLRMKIQAFRQEHNLDIARTNVGSLNEFEENLNRLNNEENRKRGNLKIRAEYKEFQTTIDAILSCTNDGDDVAETGGTTCSLLDPWSKKIMANPVRNIKCGHHYDRDSVNSVIKSNLSVLCPVVGCVSKAYIQPNGLEPDYDLLQEIRQFLDQRKPTSDDDDDDV